MQSTPITQENAPPIDPSTPHKLTIEEADEILALEDQLLRNLRVTVAYHDLSHALAAILGYEDVSWCSFAVWASRQAGGFIRGDAVEGPLGWVAQGLRIVKRDLPPERQELYDQLKKEFGKFKARELLKWWDALDLVAYMSTVEKLYDHEVGSVEHLVTLLFDTLSANISIGNTEVFREIAPAFVQFIDLLEEDAADATFNDFIHELDRSDRPAHLGGQRSLKLALHTYRKASRERDPARRSALMFLANCFVGDQEQTRLQTVIKLALGMPVEEVANDIAKRFGRGYNPSTGRWIANVTLRRILLPIGTSIASLIWKAAATRSMMVLHLPNERLNLGEDVPYLPSGEAYPPHLLDLVEEEARQCVNQFNFAYGKTLKGTGARDWSNFPERMNFATNMFRSRQQTRALFLPPFTPNAMEKIRSNFIPTNRSALGGTAPPPMQVQNGVHVDHEPPR
ncbi:hypothetical protein ACMHYB_01600 [Sorangium sp. So ce1128]